MPAGQHFAACRNLGCTDRPQADLRFSAKLIHGSPCGENPFQQKGSALTRIQTAPFSREYSHQKAYL